MNRKKTERSAPIVAFIGFANSGKTTLLKALIRILNSRGYEVGAIKHTHHPFAIDIPGKDSHELKAAGAVGVCILSSTQLGLIQTLTNAISFADVAKKYFQNVDIILVEGFKECSVPQVAIVRGAMALPKAKQLIAIVSDRPKTQTALRKSIRNFGFDEAEALANFLEKKFLR